jgi:hypothetical protein
MSGHENVSNGSEALVQISEEIVGKARRLEREASRMRSYHQLFTILTILLGIGAPALVTYTPPATVDTVVWKLIVIFTTAFATGIATVRTILRFDERYSNSALTSISLLELDAKIHAMWQEVLVTVKEQYLEQKLYEIASWARSQMLEFTRKYVEKEISTLTQERSTLGEPPRIEPEKMTESARKL